jgi:hypothetical protein
MRTLLFLTAILYAIGFIGCGGSKVGWIDKTPYYDDAIAGVGTAMHSPNTAIMRRQAETDARMAVARVLGTRVQELIKNWAQQNQSSIADQTAFNEYFESVGRAITNQDLPGVRIQEWYFDKETNAQYALAIYKRSQAIQIAKDQLETARKDLEAKKQEERLFKSRQEADRAFKELDTLLEKQLGSE